MVICGVVSLYNLYIDNIFGSFEPVTLSCNSDPFPLSPSPFLVDSVHRCKPDAKQMISTVYKLLSRSNSATLDELKVNWENATQEQISDKLWQKIIH